MTVTGIKGYIVGNDTSAGFLFGKDGHQLYLATKTERAGFNASLGWRCSQALVNLNTTVTVNLTTCGSTHSHLLPDEFENKCRVEFFCCQESDTVSFSNLVTNSIKFKAEIFSVLGFPYVFFFPQNSLPPVSPPACYQGCPSVT